MSVVEKPKNDIQKRKGQFLYLVENTDMSQKEIAEKLNVAASTIHGYNKQYKEGKLDVEPVEVNLGGEVFVPKNLPGHDKEIAEKRKSEFVYLIENTGLLQKDMAEIIGVSKAAIGKYNKAYKNGNYEDIEPKKPEYLDEYLKSSGQNEENVEDELNETSTLYIPIKEEIEEDSPTREDVEQNNVVDTTSSQEEIESSNEYNTVGIDQGYAVNKLVDNEKETIPNYNWPEDNYKKSSERKFMKASVVETTLESASSHDISSLLNLFTNQLDENNLYDLKISIRKKD